MKPKRENPVDINSHHFIALSEINVQLSFLEPLPCHTGAHLLSPPALLLPDLSLLTGTGGPAPLPADSQCLLWRGH